MLILCNLFRFWWILKAVKAKNSLSNVYKNKLISSIFAGSFALFHFRYLKSSSSLSLSTGSFRGLKSLAHLYVCQVLPWLHWLELTIIMRQWSSDTSNMWWHYNTCRCFGITCARSWSFLGRIQSTKKYQTARGRWPFTPFTTVNLLNNEQCGEIYLPLLHHATVKWRKNLSIM